jgi:23S rRNA (uracil1939-C5)-methyltransferase
VFAVARLSAAPFAHISALSQCRTGSRNFMTEQGTNHAPRAGEAGRAQDENASAGARAPVTVTTTSMASGGEAVGRVEGQVLFVKGALPGEVVSAQVVELRATWGRARVVEVLEPSPSRVEPRCRHFGFCGGCDWQYIDYPAQVAYKQSIVREQLARIAGLPDADVRPCIPSPVAYGYRNSTRLAVTDDGRAGYRVGGTRHVFAVEECPILEPGLQAELEEIHQAQLERGDEVSLRVQADPLRVGAFDYFVSDDSFFQVNTAMASRLVDEVMDRLDLREGQSVLDLYAGVGLFTLPIAQAVGSGGSVIAVESSASAVADGRRNSAAWPQAKWLQESVEDAMSSGEAGGHPVDRVVLDPPRRGVERNALLALAALRAPVVVYVSCDPATLARDARILAEKGYRLQSAQPLDLFPQTAHVETVAHFVLGGA